MYSIRGLIRGLGCGSDRQSVESDEIFDSIAGLDFFGILFSQGIRSQSSQALIRTTKIYRSAPGVGSAKCMQPLQPKSQAGKRQSLHGTRLGPSDEVQLALAALTERIPIITRSVITKRGDYALSYLDCGCRRRSEQRQQTQSRMLLEASARSASSSKRSTPRASPTGSPSSRPPVPLLRTGRTSASSGR